MITGEETKRQRVKETKRRKVKETKRGREGGTLHRTLHRTPQRACTETLHRTLHGNTLASKTIQPGRLYCECRGQRPRTAAPLAQKPYTEPCTATRWQARLSSLEGCTVSNRGQRPRTAATPQCQPGRLYAREDGGGSRTTFAANGLKAQRAHSPGQVSVANDTPGHV